MLTSLRTRLKSLRQDRDASSDARLLRQARKAEQKVIQTATAELENWEQGQGYVKTSCRTSSSPALSFKETELPVGESERTLWEGEAPANGIQKDDLAMSSQDVSSGQQQTVFSVPQITLSAFGHEEMALLVPPEDATPTQPLDTSVPSPHAEAGAATPPSPRGERTDRLQDTSSALKVLEEKEALLREIQQIRKTISDLRSGATSSSMSTEKPADLGPPTPESTPWMSATRTVSVYRPRRKSVADLFAEDAPQPMQPYHARGIASSTAPQLSLSPELKLNISSRPTDLSRHRSRSVGASTLLAERKGASELSGGTPRPSAHRKSSTAVARPKTLYDQPSSLQSGSSDEHRRIVVSEEEKSQRYRASLGRTHTKTTSACRDKAAGGRSSEMTLSELQDRHLAKLLQLQRPTTTKLAEAQALTTAREQWRQRQVAERQAQEIKLRERQAGEPQVATEANGSKSRGQSFRYSIRGRSKSVLVPSTQSGNEQQSQDPEAKEASQRPSASISAQLDACNRPMKRVEAVKRAGEWRQSVPSLSTTHIPSEGKHSGQAVRQPPPSRAQSSLGLTVPREAYQEQAARGRSHRSHSSAGLLTISQGTSGPAPIVSEGPLQSGPGGEVRRQRRELTATDIRRMREGAGRRRSTMLA